MVIWKGWGILALLIPLVCSWLTGAGVDHFYGDGFYKNNIIAMPMVFAVSAMLVFWVSNMLGKKPGRVLIDPQTDKKVELKVQHSMFWIPLRYWGLVIFAVGVWMYLANAGIIYK